MIEDEIGSLENHILVLGYGDLTNTILEKLEEKEIDFVIVIPELDASDKLKNKGFKMFKGDPSDETILKKVKIKNVKIALIATNDDPQDALTILTAKDLNPDIQIIAAATNIENIKKLKKDGAQKVISPASIASKLLVKSALNRENT